MAGTNPGALMAVVMVAALIVVAAVVAFVGARRQSQRLQERYGVEYERTLRTAGNRGAAEAELLGRERRRRQLDIRPLPGGLREGFSAQWRLIQARFVDEPRTALDDADKLLHRVMEERGYPLHDLDSQAADLSVDYGPLVSDYRSASAIAIENRDRTASTDDLRRAIVLYRSMFDALLDPGTGEASSASRFDPPERSTA